MSGRQVSLGIRSAGLQITAKNGQQQDNQSIDETTFGESSKLQAPSSRESEKAPNSNLQPPENWRKLQIPSSNLQRSFNIQIPRRPARDINGGFKGFGCH